MNKSPIKLNLPFSIRTLALSFIKTLNKQPFTMEANAHAFVHQRFDYCVFNVASFGLEVKTVNQFLCIKGQRSCDMINRILLRRFIAESE